MKEDSIFPPKDTKLPLLSHPNTYQFVKYWNSQAIYVLPSFRQVLLPSFERAQKQNINEDQQFILILSPYSIMQLCCPGLYFTEYHGLQYWYGYCILLLFMNRKRNTQLYQKPRINKPCNRRSLKYFPLHQRENSAVDGMIRSIISEYMSAAERIAHQREKSANRLKEWLVMVEQELHRHFQLKYPAKDQHIECETQPMRLNQHSISVSQTNYTQDTQELSRHKKTPDTQPDNTSEVQINKRRQSYLKKWHQIKLCKRNEFVSLNLHKSLNQLQGEDRSQQIQSLLRRKKQLLNESKSTARLHTQISRTFSTKTLQREKRNIWQDDQGDVYSIVSKPINKTTKLPVPPLKLADIKVIGGQQLCRTQVRKKTIIDLATTRKRRRREIGDTFVFIQHIQERETKLQDITERIEQKCKDKFGVRLLTKERRLTTIMKLPTLR